MFKIKITKKQDPPTDGLIVGREFMNCNSRYTITNVEGGYVWVIRKKSNDESVHSKAYILHTFESGASSWIT